MANAYVDNDSHSNAEIPTERFLDLIYEPENDLAPIKNYEKVPLVSLEEAVKPIEHLLDNVTGDIWIAKRNCKKSLDNLTIDERTAIYLYSMDSLYRQLNAALRNKDRKRLIPWFSYLKLYLTALWKLPSQRCIIWRGVKADLSDQFNEGETVIWWGFSSCTTSLKQAEQFLGKIGERTLFSIESTHGKLIENHSHYPKEHEVLLLPCSFFEVLGCIEQGNGLRIIHIRQTEPPVPLIQPPFDTSTVNHQVSHKSDKNSSHRSTTAPSANAGINPFPFSTTNTSQTLHSLKEKPRVRRSINTRRTAMGANDKYLIYCQYDKFNAGESFCVIDQHGREKLNIKYDLTRVRDICWSSFLEQFLFLGYSALYSVDITKTEQQIRHIKEFPEYANCCTCYEDTLLMYFVKGRRIEEYNMSSNWKLMKTFNSPISCKKEDYISAMRFNSNGSRLGIIIRSHREGDTFCRYLFELRNPYDNMKILQSVELGRNSDCGPLALPKQQFLVNFQHEKKFCLIDSDCQVKETIEYDAEMIHSTALINENCLVIQTGCDLLRFYDL